MRTWAKHHRSLIVLCILISGLLSVASIARALEVGDNAPDFTLASTTGEKISLSQFRGNTAVLIEFFVGESPT